MITLEGDRLVFRFPEVHEDAILRPFSFSAPSTAAAHWHDHTAARQPPLRRPPGEVVKVAERKAPQPWRQRIIPSIIRDAQRPLELDRANRVLVHLRKPEYQSIAFKRDHTLTLLTNLRPAPRARS